MATPRADLVKWVFLRHQRHQRHALIWQRLTVSEQNGSASRPASRSSLVVGRASGRTGHADSIEDFGGIGRAGDAGRNGGNLAAKAMRRSSTPSIATGAFWPGSKLQRTVAKWFTARVAWSGRPRNPHRLGVRRRPGVQRRCWPRFAGPIDHGRTGGKISTTAIWPASTASMTTGTFWLTSNSCWH